MGGARCSYRNCSQRSDQVVHMFHFPVFDKLRCHQWITNAQKQNYLNLKLSQLKNRVICQHHFTDDCFMNNLKNKLKNTAVPTLNGPLCPVPVGRSDEELLNKQDNELPINIEDIENEFLPKTEKQAHFSVKYGDFLLNDVPEGITLKPYPVASIKKEDTGMAANRFGVNFNLHSSSPYDDAVRKNISFTKPRIIANKKILKPIKRLPSNPKVVSIEYEELNLNPTNQDEAKVNESCITQPNMNLDNVAAISNTKSKTVTDKIPSTKKVKIISEKQIYEPLQISKAEFQPVSPSIVINVPHKKKKSNIAVDGQEIGTVFYDSTNNMLASQNNQQFHNSSSISTQVGDTLSLNEYGQPTALGSQRLSSLNNSQISKEPMTIDIVPVDFVSEAYQNNETLKRETEMFSDIEHNMPTVPNVEFVSTSLAGPSVFTLVNVPPVTRTTDSSYTQDVSHAEVDVQNALLTSQSEILTTNSQQAKTLNSALDNSETRQRLTTVNEKQITSKNTSPSKSQLKPKMPPEKLAAIEKKRKYNMKLRDIIHSCLNNMEEEPDIEKLTVALRKEIGSKKVDDHLAKVSSQPENSIAYFEHRLQRMEDLLLNKIEQNSQKITDLKKSIKINTNKKTTSTQTYQNAEENKKSLYQQISQYLSPEANSLIYEELFINQCLAKTRSSTKRKRR